MSWRSRLHRALVRQAHWRMSLVVRIGLDWPEDHEGFAHDVAAAARVAFHGGRYGRRGYVWATHQDWTRRGSDERRIHDGTQGWFARMNLDEEPATGKQRARWRRMARRDR